MVRLFDISNGKVVPSEHCYVLKFLKDIMEEYPEDHLKIYAYLFYMTCPNPDLNPFFDVPESDKEELVLKEVDATFSTDDDLIVKGIAECKILYETPTYRAYTGIKEFLDKMGDSLKSESITYGRNGNAEALLRMAERFDNVRQSYKGVFRDLLEEQKSTVRGGQNLAYDQR